MIPSALRRLARDYFEGRIDREAYHSRRRILIERWIDGSENEEEDTPPGDTHETPTLDLEKPDAGALVDALAERNGGLTDPGSSFAEQSLLPDFDRLEADRAAATSSSVTPEPVLPAAPRRRPAAVVLIWLLGAVVAFSVAVLVWLSL